MQNEATNRKKLKRQYVFHGWKIFQLLQFENYLKPCVLLEQCYFKRGLIFHLTSWSSEDVGVKKIDKIASLPPPS